MKKKFTVIPGGKKEKAEKPRPNPLAEGFRERLQKLKDTGPFSKKPRPELEQVPQPDSELPRKK